MPKIPDYNPPKEGDEECWPARVEALIKDLDERIARFETGAAYEREAFDADARRDIAYSMAKFVDNGDGTFSWPKMGGDEPSKAIEFPRHSASMTIEHNPHINEHVSIEECVSSFCPDAWASDEEREKSIEIGELWTIQWYPDTPIGFLVVHASTFDAAMSAAVQLQIEDDNH